MLKIVLIAFLAGLCCVAVAYASHGKYYVKYGFKAAGHGWNGQNGHTAQVDFQQDPHSYHYNVKENDKYIHQGASTDHHSGHGWDNNGNNNGGNAENNGK